MCRLIAMGKFLAYFSKPPAKKTLPTTEEEIRKRARHAVASSAMDAEDCRKLLDMLGLFEEEPKKLNTIAVASFNEHI